MLATKVIRTLIFSVIFVVIRSKTNTLEQGMILSVQVLPELPWYMQFTFISSARDFEPLTLKATHTRTSQKFSSTEAPIEFSLSAGANYRHFRNRVPQNFAENDVIRADLEYFNTSSGHKQKISFDYVIKNKDEDFVIIGGSETLNASEVGESTKNPPSSSLADNIFGVNAGVIFTEDNVSTQRDCLISDSDCEYQDELLRTAIEHGNVGTKLLLAGQQPPLSNAVDAIRTIIVDKLQLRHLAFSILQAQFRDEGILFEMATPRNAIEVLTKARLLLKHSPFKIRSTDMNFVDISLLQRTTGE